MCPQWGPQLRVQRTARGARRFDLSTQEENTMLQRPTKPGVRSSNLLSSAALRLIPGGGGRPRPQGADFITRTRALMAIERSRELQRDARRLHRTRAALEAVLRMFADPIRRAVRG